MTINGFEVAVFNQYKLPEGKKQSTCPKCSVDRKKNTEKCLMIDWERALATCQHCSEVLQIHGYKRSNKPMREYVVPKQREDFELSDNVVQWFQGRGISAYTLEHMRISEGIKYMPQVKKEVNTIQFNYYINSILTNIKYRDGAKNFMMYKDAEKIFYNIDNIRYTDEVIIVEGEMDVLSYVESGYENVISVPNGATKGNINLDFLDSCYEFFESKKKIYIATDADEAGENLKKEFIRRFGAEVCYNVDFKGLKDANEYLMSYGEEALSKTIKDATACPLENIITYEDVKDKLRDFYLNGSPKGYQIGLDSFDNIFSTETGQYITVTGIPRSGKSDFVDQMCVGYNMKYGWKTAFCSPENKPEYLHLDKLCRKFMGTKPSNYDDIESVGFKKVEEHIDENFYFLNYRDGYNLTDVLKKGAELVKRKGIKCLVLDPFNKIPLKESKMKGVNDYTNDYLQMIDNFCQKYNVLVILVAHPVKMRKVDGKTPEPDFYDIKGGGEFFDMSYHGLLIHRDWELELVKVKVLKIKFQHLGKNEEEVWFNWNINNGRYSELDTDSWKPTDSGDIPATIWDNSNWITNKLNDVVQSEFEMPMGEDFDI